MKRIYFDYNASTPLFPKVKEAMKNCFSHYANPSSLYQEGKDIRLLIEESRLIIAKDIGVESSQVIFTAGGTEANNLILKQFDSKDILISSIEHSSVFNVVPDATIIRVDQYGYLDCQDLEKKLKQKKYKLLSLIYAHNELGTIQDVKKIIPLVKKYGVKVHLDSIQALSKVKYFEYSKIGADFLTISAHKIGGPKGIGALVIPKDFILQAQQMGGGQEFGFRAGTENILGIVGFTTAVEEVKRVNWDKIFDMKQKIVQSISNNYPEVKMFGIKLPSLPNTICFAYKTKRSSVEIAKFDLEGIAVSSGSACSAGKIGPSRILQSLGYIGYVPIRLSLGWENTLEDVNYFLEKWKKVYEKNIL